MYRAWYNKYVMEIQNKITEYEEALFGEYKAEFEKFREMLLEYNEKYNLTTILEKQDVYYKHFLDSIAGESFLKKARRLPKSVRVRGSPLCL